jgi:hypothetical protein
MHRRCIRCVSLPIMRSRKLLQELKEAERQRIILTHFLLRPHNLKMSASSLSTKMWMFEMSSSSCGIVTAVFDVFLPFGECKKKQCASDTWKIIALHEGFHLSPLCSSNSSIIKVKMGIQQWWMTQASKSQSARRKTLVDWPRVQSLYSWWETGTQLPEPWHGQKTEINLHFRMYNYYSIMSASIRKTSGECCTGR